MKLEIYKEDDRLAVAAILVKNGYRVSQGKEKKTPAGRAFVYYIEAQKVDEEVKKHES